MNPRRRSKKIVKPRLQFKMFGWMLIIFAAWFLSILAIYGFTVRRVSEIQGDEVFLQHFLQDISMFSVILLAVVIFVSLIIGVHLTHRIAGPLFRLEKTIEKMNKGIIPKDFQFRKTDEKEYLILGELFKSLIDRFRSFYTTSRDLSLILDRIVSDNVVDESEMELMKNELKKFEQFLDYYQLEDNNEQEGHESTQKD